MKHTTLTLLRSRGPRGRWYVTVNIGRDEFDLGNFGCVSEACRYMGRWVSQRGLVFAADSYERLWNAYDVSDVVVFVVVRKPFRN